jgi:dihydropyrimidinase
VKTLIRGGRIVTASQDYVGDIFVEDGKIQALGSLPDIGVDSVVDATGKLVLPGGVDPHTHLDAPLKGTITADDFYTGTVAAAVGGTTTIIDFPVQQLGDDPRVSHEQWYERAESKAVIDWGLHQIITDLPDAYLPVLDDLVRAGVPSFKLFMAYPGARMVDDATIFKAMRRTAENGGFILMHCENGLVIDLLEKEALARNETDPVYNAATRPPITEAEATARAISLAELAEVPTYIVHLAAAEALRAVSDARARGVPVYAETCPHYLLLTEEKLSEPDFGGSKYVMCPPLRSRENQTSLWRGLQSNDLQVVSTDHTPFCFHGQKDMGRYDFSKIPNGVPGIEWRTTLLYHFGVTEGRMSLNRLVQLLSTNPAKLFGLYPRKGDIAPGSDADIVVFDPGRPVNYSAKQQQTRSDYNPYEGWTTLGAPEKVMLRGEVIVDDGRFVGRRGQGRFVPRGGPGLLDRA